LGSYINKSEPTRLFITIAYVNGNRRRWGIPYKFLDNAIESLKKIVRKWNPLSKIIDFRSNKDINESNATNKGNVAPIP
jgi:hypothetical protein